VEGLEALVEVGVLVEAEELEGREVVEVAQAREAGAVEDLGVLVEAVGLEEDREVAGRGVVDQVEGAEEQEEDWVAAG
jgi:hypothetical protein